MKTTKEKTAGGLPYIKVSVPSGPFKWNATEPNPVTELERELTLMARSQPRDEPIIVDLAGAEEVDSKGISALLKLHREVFKTEKPGEWPLSFILSPQVYGILQEFYLNPVLLCFADERQFEQDYETVQNSASI